MNSQLLFLFLTFFLHHTHSFPTPTATPPTTATSFDFIRSSCNTTLYPDVCYTSLSRYANAVRLDPAQLARISIGLTLARARHASAFFANMTQRADYGPDPRATSALHDCSSTFGDAVDQIHKSLKEMSQVASAAESSTIEALRFQLSNVQTWMSAALTNEDTCTDGFEDVAECPVKDEVFDKIVIVKEYTSNALALVNSYAASVNPR
ncbi:pectinesterase inhibitor 7-like [Chenopodium quinoa]|uniref:pectinesterase inhibitor 7-like n=1 Tax=Chenopodium quinoa TaxID=63459 RepID=UPI000B77F01B|nr:pectinesterase inhibitor 7-like [Chenopodium quinoa]